MVAPGARSGVPKHKSDALCRETKLALPMKTDKARASGLAPHFAYEVLPTWLLCRER